MEHIEVDWEVWHKLTKDRKGPSDTLNNVIRRVLNLGPHEESSPISEPSAPAATQRAWTPTHGVSFPAGTEFRATYKGRTITGRVEGGALVVDGKKYKSPSGAAMSITSSAVNGWRFWEYRIAGDNWKPIYARRSVARTS